MDWDFDTLWAKARLYVARALDEERESPLFALWFVLALEALCRSALALIHPALLADPRDGKNLLYAFGFQTDNPKSVAMGTVVKRLEVVIPEFTNAEARVVNALIERRNAELHSGHVAFDDYPTELWLADYYAVAEIIVNHMDRVLEDLLGGDEADVARQMIEGRSEDLRGEVEKALAVARDLFADLDAEARATRLNRARSRFPSYSTLTITTTQECPACGSPADVKGQRVRLLEPRAEEDVIVRSVVALPTALECPVCELKLDTHNALHIAGRGGQFTVDEEFDPADYYGIEFDPADYFEPDYGND